MRKLIILGTAVAGTVALTSINAAARDQSSVPYPENYIFSSQYLYQWPPLFQSFQNFEHLHFFGRRNSRYSFHSRSSNQLRSLHDLSILPVSPFQQKAGCWNNRRSRLCLHLQRSTERNFRRSIFGNCYFDRWSAFLLSLFLPKHYSQEIVLRNCLQKTRLHTKPTLGFSFATSQEKTFMHQDFIFTSTRTRFLLGPGFGIRIAQRSNRFVH